MTAESQVQLPVLVSPGCGLHAARLHGRMHGALTLWQWGHHVAKYLTTTGCRQEMAKLKFMPAS